MPWSKLDIVNLAMNRLNKHSVNSLEDSGEFADSAKRAFDMLYPSEIAGYSWRFATKIQQLSVLVEPPILNRIWTYQLQLPADYLAVVRTWPRVPFQIYNVENEDVLFCNFNVVYLEYRFLPEITHLPSYFVRYFSVLIAAWFADAVAEDDNLSRTLTNEANLLRAQALFNDSQSHPIPAMISAPLIQVRGGGGTWGNGFNGEGYGWM